MGRKIPAPLWRIWSGFFNLSEAAIQRTKQNAANFIYEKISRNSVGSSDIDNDKSLTVFELMAGARFKFLLSEWK